MVGIIVILLGVIYLQVREMKILKNAITNNAILMAEKFNELYKEVFVRDNEVEVYYEEDEEE
jgi:hypothetical protein